MINPRPLAPGAMRRDLQRDHEARLADSGAILAHAPNDAAGEDIGPVSISGEDLVGADCSTRPASGSVRRGHGDGPMAPRARASQVGTASPSRLPSATAPESADAGSPLLRHFMRHAGNLRPHPPGQAAAPVGAANLPMIDSLRRSLGHMAGNMESLAEIGWDLRDHTPTQGQAEAIALMLSDLQGRQPPLPAPWVVAQVDAGVLLITGLIRNRLWQLGHRRLSLHLSDEGFVDWLCGRWRWRPKLGWQHQPWTAAENLAGGVRPHRGGGLATSDPARWAAAEAKRPASLALEALIRSSGRDLGATLEDFQVSVCDTSRQLAALIQTGSLAAPVALLTPGLAPGGHTDPPSANLIRGFDEGGPYLLTSPLRTSPTVVRSPEIVALMRPLSRAQHAAAPQDCDAEILADLCRHRPVGALASLMLEDGMANVQWLDLPALRLAEVHQSCSPLTPIFTCRLGRGQKLNGAALAALCGQQMDKLLP